MRLIDRTAVVSCALVTVLAACGQVDPVLMPVSMPECIYQGPSSMREGNARVSLTLNGIGDFGVALVELTGEKTPVDLSTHVDSTGRRWADRPPWVTPVLELELASGEGRDGIDETVDLVAGNYAIVCLDHPGDGAAVTGIAGPVTVEPG